MKWLVPLIFISTPLCSQTNEIIDPELKKRVMTVVKDVDVEKQLMGASEVQRCLKDIKYDESKNYSKTGDFEQTKLKDCLDKELKSKNPKSLEALSKSLELEKFGLVKNNTINELSGYFTKKIQRALTGVDPDEKNVKFEDRKIVDQKVYLELSLNHLQKSALYEVSRFCFENLRRTDPSAPKTNFNEHWDNFKVSPELSADKPDYATIKTHVINHLTDDGNPPYGDFQSKNLGEQKEIYQVISNSLSPKGGQLSEKKLFEIFGYCSYAIRALCDNFQDDPTKTKPGANACLVKNKIAEINSAIAKTQLVIKSFEDGDLSEEERIQSVVLLKNGGQLYQYGNSSKEKNLDEITTLTSSDILNKLEEDDLKDLASKCSTAATYDDLSEECQQFAQKSDGVNKALYLNEAALAAKRETEIAIIEKLKENPEDLKKYLSDNNYFDLLSEFEKDPNYNFKNDINKIYDSRIKAEKDAIQKKVGSRQISDSNITLQTSIGGEVQKTINETREEKSRLAQVVLFNNIITSTIKVQDRSTKATSSNTTAMAMEREGHQNADGLDQELFENIGTDSSQRQNSPTKIEENQFINLILGKDS